MKITNILFTLFIGILFFSCSEESELTVRDMIFNQNNVTTGNTLPTTNVLSFSPSSINFGTVQNGTFNQGSIAITNSHNTSVTITVTHTSSVTAINAFSATNFEIPANGTYNFTFYFSPTTTMTLSDALHFSYPANVPNSSGPLTQSVNLTGNSVATLPTILTISPSGTLDFGNVIVGQTATRNISLNNTGTASASWTPVGTVFTFTPNSGTIIAGNSQQVTLAFTATASGVYSNTQTFSYNGGTVQIPYTVNRIAATRIIGVVCTTYTAFGNVPVNTTVNKTITISNTGNSNLTISQITSSQVPNGQFTCNYSGVIAPGSSVNVPISFKPTSTGSKTCNITVQSDKTSGNNTLSFTGSGI